MSQIVNLLDVLSVIISGKWGVAIRISTKENDMKSNDEEDEEDGWEADDTELTGVMATMCPTTLQ